MPFCAVSLPKQRHGHARPSRFTMDVLCLFGNKSCSRWALVASSDGSQARTISLAACCIAQMEVSG